MDDDAGELNVYLILFSGNRFLLLWFKALNVLNVRRKRGRKPSRSGRFHLQMVSPPLLSMERDEFHSQNIPVFNPFNSRFGKNAMSEHVEGISLQKNVSCITLDQICVKQGNETGSKQSETVKRNEIAEDLLIFLFITD